MDDVALEDVLPEEVPPPEHPAASRARPHTMTSFHRAAPSKAEAAAAAKAVGALLDLAADDATRAKIGDMIAVARRGQPLPPIEDVRRRLGLGIDPGTPGMTVAEWLDGWLAGKKRAKRASTYRGYESHVRVHINPVIGTSNWSASTPGTSRPCWPLCPARPGPGTACWPRCGRR
jgi:hypothetical protein